MPEPLKNMYNHNFFAGLIPYCKKVIPAFPEEELLKRVFAAGWDDLEFKQRMKHIARVFAGLLPGEYPKQLKTMLALCNALLKGGVRPQGIEYAFITEFVELYGTDYPELSLDAMEHITRLMSCEFAVRPFLIADMEGVMARMYKHSLSPDENIRRFSSEGCRPRLPWGMAIPALKKDPALVLRVLENLKDDPSLYVRKSVANNLNDISKDHPELVLSIARQWKGTSERTDRILKQALRTLLKQGNADALALFSINSNTACTISGLAVSPARVPIGGTAQLTFGLIVKGTGSVKLRIAYRIDYIKKTGKTGGKVFFISEGEFETGKEYFFNKKLSFTNYTTRTHYPDLHNITVIVNGNNAAVTRVEVSEECK